MAKQTIERVWTNLATGTTTWPKSPVTISHDGDYYFLTVPLFAYGFVSRVLVNQVTGTPVQFSVELLSCGLGLGYTSLGEMSPTTFNSITGWQNYRIVSTIGPNPAGTQAQVFTPAGNVFRNQDGGANNPIAGVSSAGYGSGPGYTDAVKNVYVVIQPTLGSGGVSTWNVNVAGYSESDR
jgi:hypothetical protein